VEGHYVAKPKTVAAEEELSAPPSAEVIGKEALSADRLGWPLATLFIVGASVLLWAVIAWFVAWLLR
jgi:hypothetical protein